MGASCAVPTADGATIECGTFVPGMFVSLLYSAPTNGSRLTLNFSNGDDDPLNVYLNVYLCHNDNILVLNSKLDGGWQHNESPDGFLQENNTQTQMVVLAKEDAFGIYADKGRHKYSYQYRDEVTKVKRIQYLGNETAAIVSIGRFLPDFAIGKKVHIDATAPKEDKFAIDFIPSPPDHYIPDDVHFHMSFRFGINQVVKNTKKGGTWGTEETENGIPFSAGDQFRMDITTEKDRFVVELNENHFTDYKYRVGELSSEMCVQLRNVPSVANIDYS